ncbi:brain-specific angiogenesis inhibitor 1-associated protein 2-like protein 1a [Clupea harengus]|uniref:BAR/IMD domain-containing adapter protein 2-like 1 n=1 Tax=Clupea harengus TaxID=7950 RepID=A0A6P3WBG6_CLUHA|nr:brain-specific angiogenesis inhibitor 1-associated protein 2-like protein 1a [Clupea harengus]
MSRDPEDVNKLTESTYKNVVENFNPALRNLVNLGKSYEKSVTAMNLAGKAYFDAVSKIGENAAVSPVSRELGVVLMEISESQKKVQLELEETFKRFHRDIIAELEKKTELDVKYMNATFKRYQSEHKLKQDSLDRSQSDLKKLRRKSQGKHSSKYEVKENECIQTLSSRQMDMQKHIAEGCQEALLEEKRRFCFLVDKHCTFAHHMSTFHDKAKGMLEEKLPVWQDKCSDATKVPDTVMTMIEGLRTPVSMTPDASPLMERLARSNSETVGPPPAPALKAQISPLANMFTQDIPRSPISVDLNSAPTYLSSLESTDQDSLGSSGLSRSTSVSSDMNLMRKPRVLTIFPHTAGNNDTLLSFDDGDFITLLIQEEKDGWLYGELEKTGQRGWFPSSYCRPYSEPAGTNRMDTPVYGGGDDLHEQPDEEEDEGPVLLPPADYSDTSLDSPSKTFIPSPESPVVSNGISKPPFLGGGNPFATIKLRPTVTNDRSAPHV